MVENWRVQILKNFQKPLNKLLLVSDPDDMLSDEQIILFLKEHRIQILQFEDRAKLRYLYEQLKGTNGTLLFKTKEKVTNNFPYDLLQKGQLINLNVSDLFPSLSPPILKQLDTDALDVLSTSKKQFQGNLNNNETCEFILQKVYKLPYQFVESEIDLVKFLIQKHSSKLRVPEVLDDYLIDYFEKKKLININNMDELIKSKSFFFYYLQNEWEKYITLNIKSNEYIKENGIDNYYSQHLFESEEIKGLIYNLFIEGKLEPLEVKESIKVPIWAEKGIVFKQDNPIKTILEIQEKINNILENIEVHYKDWIEVIGLYSHAKNIELNSNRSENILNQTEANIDSKFKEWLLKEYQALQNLSYYNGPIMVHHIPHFLKLNSNRKQALIVIDGMSFIQWRQIKSYLSSYFSIEENGVYAWIPTITSISRSSIFKGEIPLFHNAASEESSWKIFWEKESILKNHISFENIFGQGVYSRDNIKALQTSNIKKAGIVIRTIDNFIHGAIQGLKGIHAETNIWLKSSFLKELLDDLLSSGYDIFITSDHGNKECKGIGKLKQGILANTRGERVRIYEDETLRDVSAEEYSSIRWPNIGLSDNQYVLLAESKKAFITENQEIVSHGGISLEEVIVPFVKVTKLSNWS